MKVHISYWEYKSGTPMTEWEEASLPGWSCWAYPDDNREFEKWMKTNCPTANCIHRFNSGNPMYTVYITNEEEATSFKLQWK